MDRVWWVVACGLSLSHIYDSWDSHTSFGLLLLAKLTIFHTQFIYIDIAGTILRKMRLNMNFLDSKIQIYIKKLNNKINNLLHNFSIYHHLQYSIFACIIWIWSNRSFPIFMDKPNMWEIGSLEINGYIIVFFVPCRF